MKAKVKSLLIVILVLMVSSIASGANQYGEATIQKGNVVVVRDGRMYLYTTVNNPVTLYENDTIRTLKNSALTFYNPDQNRVILGANAIMQLKEWQSKKESGNLRMLFGKFRARTASARKASSLNIRTATATIGIKGSLGEGATGSDFTALSNLSGEMSLTDNQGEGFDIPVGQFGFNVSGQGIGFRPIPGFDPSKTEDEMEGEGTEQLDSESSKQVDLPPAVRKAIVDKLTEVADAGVDPDYSQKSDDELLTDFWDHVQEAQSTRSDQNPAIKATIKIED